LPPSASATAAGSSSGRRATPTRRIVFNRPIGQNQGVQFPIARAHVNVEAADLMRINAAEMFDRREACGSEANMAKLLAADASWEAANVAVQTHGGFGFAEDYDIERKFRRRGCIRWRRSRPTDPRLRREHVLGLPRSY
jgi:acyl-CoA dehydrogenase